MRRPTPINTFPLPAMGDISEEAQEVERARAEEALDRAEVKIREVFGDDYVTRVDPRGVPWSSKEKPRDPLTTSSSTASGAR
jgi:hypothetical protein